MSKPQLKSQNFFKKYNIKPNKVLGQNFLIDEKVLNKIIETAELSENDTVLEIGPGLGILTLELAKKAKRVIAVEKDKKLAEILRNALKKNRIANVDVVEADILKFPIPNSPARGEARQERQFPIPNKVVANIPYYLTSPLIRKFLESDNPPESMVLMVQKEVAQRICAKPPKMTLLSVAVQFYAEPKIVSCVSKKSFWPQPKVDSAIIKITPKTTPISELHPNDPNIFFRVVKSGFSHPRKQLINNLSTGLNLDRQTTEKILLSAGLKPTWRAGELTVDKWRKMAVLLVEKIGYNKK